MRLDPIDMNVAAVGVPAAAALAAAAAANADEEGEDCNKIEGTPTLFVGLKMFFLVALPVAVPALPSLSPCG